MQADAHYAHGHSHTPWCQDYAVARDGVVVVSDGCSKSPHSDVGARLLAHAALEAHLFLKQENPRALLHEYACHRAGYAQHVLRLPTSALDATLLYLHPVETGVEAKLYGDGVVFGRVRETGKIVSCSVSFPSGAPYYPNYRMDGRRHSRYCTEFGTRKALTFSGFYEHDIVEEALILDEFVMAFPSDIYDLVGVGTDGLTDFTKVGENGQRVKVPLADVLAQICAIPVLNGAFVTRRLRKFLSDYCVKNGWRPEDDVGVGMISVEAP